MGFDKDFVAPVNALALDDLTCPICLDILLDPTGMPCEAQHAFCAACIASSLDTSTNGRYKCPVCREESAEKPRALPFLARITGSLDVACCNKPCPWSGKLADYAKHKSGCPFRLIPCVACSEPVPATTVPSHLSEHCRKSKSTVCRFCQRVGSYEVIKAHEKLEFRMLRDQLVEVAKAGAAKDRIIADLQRENANLRGEGMLVPALIQEIRRLLKEVWALSSKATTECGDTSQPTPRNASSRTPLADDASVQAGSDDPGTLHSIESVQTVAPASSRRFASSSRPVLPVPSNRTAPSNSVLTFDFTIEGLQALRVGDQQSVGATGADSTGNRTNTPQPFRFGQELASTGVATSLSNMPNRASSASRHFKRTRSARKIRPQRQPQRAPEPPAPEPTAASNASASSTCSGAPPA